MAVYKTLDKRDIEEILWNYSIVKLNSFEAIQEVIENTNNYLLVEEK